MAQSVDGWSELASLFNDPDLKFENPFVFCDRDDNGDLTCTDVIYISIFENVKNIDPNIYEDHISIDGEWIRKHMNILKRDISLAYERFSRSGRQDGNESNLASDWLKDATYVSNLYNFTSNATQTYTVSVDIIMYAFAYMDQQQIMNIGRVMREDGIDGDDDDYHQPKGKRHRKGKGSDGKDDDDNTTVISTNVNANKNITDLAQSKKDNDLALQKLSAIDIVLTHSDKLDPELVKKSQDYLTKLLDF